MTRDSRRNVEDVLHEGIRQIKADLRIVPDPGLYDKISGALSQSDMKSAIFRNEDKISFIGIRRPIVKLGWAITAGAAAVITGILVGNVLYSGIYNSEKEAYKQEITMQSSDISGLNAQFVNYYNEENP